jgi:hypothetical protein
MGTSRFEKRMIYELGMPFNYRTLEIEANQEMCPARRKWVKRDPASRKKDKGGADVKRQPK